MELSNDILKLEEDLENHINSSLDTEVKIGAIKSILAKIVTAEASITKFTKMVSDNNNNNNNNNNNLKTNDK